MTRIEVFPDRIQSITETAGDEVVRVLDLPARKPGTLRVMVLRQTLDSASFHALADHCQRIGVADFVVGVADVDDVRFYEFADRREAHDTEAPCS